jgi:hypothetical protein
MQEDLLSVEIAHVFKTQHPELQSSVFQVLKAKRIRGQECVKRFFRQKGEI